MPRIEGEDAFMASLLADLDSEAFAPPSSSQTHTASRPPSQPRAARPRPLKRTAPSSQPPSQPLTPRKRAARPPPPPSLNPARDDAEPFWDNPLARPLLSPAALARRDQVERAAGFAPGLAKDGARSRKVRALGEAGDSGEPRRVKRVEIGIQGKENSSRSSRDEREVEEKMLAGCARRVKDEVDVKPVVEVKLPRAAVQPPAEVDEFDALLGGVDWDEAMLGFEDEQAVEASVRPLRLLLAHAVSWLTLPLLLQVVRTPRCKQYARCTVEEVVERVGTTIRPQKVRLALPLEPRPRHEHES